MCDPFTIASVALTAGSMAANSVAQSKVNKARNGAMEAERIRQRQLQQEADALNAVSQDRYQGFEGKQDERSSELGKYFTDQVQSIPEATGAPTETVPTSSSNIVNTEKKKQGEKTKAFSTQQATALGNLRGFGDLLGETSRLQGRDAAQIGTVGGMMKGSQSVLPLELEAANNKGSGWKTFGDLLSAGATISGGVGAAKAAAGGNTIFSSAAQGPSLPGMPAPRAPTWLGRAVGSANWGV
jgi:hypothetical protein